VLSQKPASVLISRQVELVCALNRPPSASLLLSTYGNATANSCGRIYCPYRRHLIFRENNTTNLLSHPTVTPLMLVTTYYHPRNPSHPNETDEIEGSWPQDGLPGAIGEGGDRGDLMGGSQAGLYSSEEGEEHNSVWWHVSGESDIFKEEEWNQEESDHLEFNDVPEGTLSALKGRTPR